MTKNAMSEYRQWLIAAEQKAQDDFDKTVLSLSGGALGISFVFLEDVIGTNPIISPCYLLAAWVSWGFSTLAVLVSFYLSHLALRRAISQVDSGTIHSQRPGGKLAIATAVLNAMGALLFVLGVCSITAFAQANLIDKGDKHAEPKATVSTAAPATTPKTPTTTAPRTAPGKERRSGSR